MANIQMVLSIDQGRLQKGVLQLASGAAKLSMLNLNRPFLQCYTYILHPVAQEVPKHNNYWDFRAHRPYVISRLYSHSVYTTHPSLSILDIYLYIYPHTSQNIYHLDAIQELFEAYSTTLETSFR